MRICRIFEYFPFFNDNNSRKILFNYIIIEKLKIKNTSHIELIATSYGNWSVPLIQQKFLSTDGKR